MNNGQRPNRSGTGPANPSKVRKNETRTIRRRTVIPDVFHGLLDEVLDGASKEEDIPLQGNPPKRRKTRHTDDTVSLNGSVQSAEEQPEDVSFEDVFPAAGQVIYGDSDEESEESDDDATWVGFDVTEPAQATVEEGDLDLILEPETTPQRRQSIRRKGLTQEDRSIRLVVHKMHILSQLAHIARRNRWCNDEDVQSSLQSLLPQKVRDDLRPKKTLSQFRQTDLLKQGLEQTNMMWMKRFKIVSRGWRKSYWVEDGQAQDYTIAADVEPPMEKSDFVKAARTLQGSRDLGAQLYCALLRGVGLEARLVCSLQPLPFTAAPTMPVAPVARSTTPDTTSTMLDARPLQPSESMNTPFSARRRLGHPNAADYHLPDIGNNSSPVKRAKPKVKRIRESPYPVFWVEVLDEAHQKWMPVDGFVTNSIAKPQVFEPPMADHENSMSYVIAFEDDGSVRDVTRRYTKAYNAKTRKTRVEITEGGAKWWKRTTKYYARSWQRDLDQIEDIELASLVAREPMPKSITDFKDHPVYALERHLRKNEILVTRHEVGKVAGGRDASAPGGKRLESVYRRSDVKIARSADRWYRLGRDIKEGERPRGELYTENQTQLYAAPPVVKGRVPRNTFGNIDVYVPTMVPAGGVHIPLDEAARASRVLSVDYADAVTGFKFEGRQGRPVINGIVTAVEHREAILAVLEGFRDERSRAAEEYRALQALRMWKRFMIGLRVKERVDGYVIEGEEQDGTIDDEDGSDVGMMSEEYDDDEAGGFFPE